MAVVYCLPETTAIKALAEWISARYDIGSEVVYALLRAYTNDVYSVSSARGRFALKIYGSGWRSEEEIRYEIALLLHLVERGVSVAAPVAGRDGDVLGSIVLPAEGPVGGVFPSGAQAAIPEDDVRPPVASTSELQPSPSGLRGSFSGARYAVLTTFAPGSKPEPPFTIELYRSFGEAIGRMHRYSDDFEPAHVRSPLNLRALIDDPLKAVLALAHDTHIEKLLSEVGSVVARRIESFGDALDFGPIHGDATLDNLHVTSDGEVTLYDFDSGGPGFRASDLQGWAVGLPEFAAKREAFLCGYRQARPLRPADIEAAPYLTLAWEIWGLWVDTTRRPLSNAETHAYLARRAAELARRSDTLAALL